MNLTTENNNDENANAKDYKLSVKKSKIQEIAKDAVEVKSEANSGITVTPDKTTDTKKTTYKLTLDGAKIKELAGTTNVDKTYAKVDGSNIKDLNADNKKAWATGIGASSITDTTKDQLVTGSAVKTYVDGKEITISGDNGNGKLKLDGKLDIIGRSGTNNLEVKTWQHGPNAQPDKQEDYTTENVTTHYETTADGKQQIFVGIKEKPTFKKITLKDGDTKQVDLTPTEDSLSLNNKKLTGLAEATSNTDAINKKQFDEELNKKKQMQQI